MTAQSGATGVAKAPPQARPRHLGSRPLLSEGARAERRLGWLLCAPAVIVMLAVTAYPIGYAVWLSLQRYDLRFPAERQFIGLANYATVLTSNLWWTAFGVTVLITVVSVVVELVLGMGLALVMHRALVGRGLVRTAILVPYGIVTVVAAFSWRYAWTPGTGYLANLLPSGTAPLTQRGRRSSSSSWPRSGRRRRSWRCCCWPAWRWCPRSCSGRPRWTGPRAWQRFTQIMLPLMKPAILVALLFRTLDAFRIFDNIFILTAGANNTRRCRSSPTTTCSPRSTWASAPHVGADLHRGGDHRVHLHQAASARRRRAAQEGNDR